MYHTLVCYPSIYLEHIFKCASSVFVLFCLISHVYLSLAVLLSFVVLSPLLSLLMVNVLKRKFRSLKLNVNFCVVFFFLQYMLKVINYSLIVSQFKCDRILITDIVKSSINNLTLTICAKR